MVLGPGVTVTKRVSLPAKLAASSSAAAAAARARFGGHRIQLVVFHVRQRFSIHL